MKVTMASFPSHSSSSSILLNTGQVFDCAKDKSSIVNGKQLLTNNKPLNASGGGGGAANVSTSSSHKGHSRDREKSSAAAAAGKYSNNSHTGSRKGCCRCMGPKSTAFWIGLLTNLGICTLLLAYTLLGSFLFMTIEGGALSDTHTILASTTSRQLHPYSSNIGHAEDVDYVKYHHPHPQQPNERPPLDNITFSPAAMRDATEARHKTVENIWDITVSLNILYRDNWTRLAELEIAKFQDQVIKRLRDDMVSQLDGAVASSAPASGTGAASSPVTGAVILNHQHHQDGGESPANEIEWTLPKAFLYSLTVLTTIGYGCMTPRTTLGRMTTLAYAVLGIPLTLIYLSSTGSVLSRVARGVFSRALCCCLCSNCGYCCYDEKRMAEKERRTKKKRQLEEQQRARDQQHILLKEPYYVRAGGLHSSASASDPPNNLHSPEKAGLIVLGPGTSASFGGSAAAAAAGDLDSLSTCTESKASSMHGLSLLAPILLCIAMMMCYIAFGALTLYHLEDFPLLDGVFFCFMSLSTIGFGDLGQLLRRDSASDVTIWFCSAYIMSGMALTAMCFDVLHSEIVSRIKSVVTEIKRGSVINLGGGGGGSSHEVHNEYSMAMP